jgi:tetratricopeptide (TPR) repeat protein
MNPSLPQTYVNLAHLHASEGNSSSAITLYQKCLDEFYSKSGNKEIELWICRIYYLEGDFENAKKIIMRLIHRHSEDMILQFNLALTLQAGAYQYL